MSVKLLTEHHLKFLSLGGCTGSSESTLVIVGNHMSLLIWEGQRLNGGVPDLR